MDDTDDQACGNRLHTLPCIIVFCLLGVSWNALPIIKGSRQVQGELARFGKRILVLGVAVVDHFGLEILLVGHCDVSRAARC